MLTIIAKSIVSLWFLVMITASLLPASNLPGSSTFQAASSSTPRPTKTLRPTRTPIPTKTPKPSPTFESPFSSFDALCKMASKLDDVEQRAFNQKNDELPVGPWRGRVEDYNSRDSVVFTMNSPSFKRKALGDLRTVILAFPKQRYEINEIYDFHGKFISVHSSGRICVVALQADNREKANKIVKP